MSGQVFAPLARLLGLYSIKEELEELAFSYSKPEEYAMLRRRLDNLAKEQQPVVLQVIYVIWALLSVIGRGRSWNLHRGSWSKVHVGEG